MQKVLSFYFDDISKSLLKAQLKTLPAVIGMQSDDVNTFNDIRKLVHHLKNPLRGLTGEVVKTLKLIFSKRATNLVSKRSFCAMCRLFTYLRTNMGLIG